MKDTFSLHPLQLRTDVASLALLGASFLPEIEAEASMATWRLPVESHLNIYNSIPILGCLGVKIFSWVFLGVVLVLRTSGVFYYYYFFLNGLSIHTSFFFCLGFLSKCMNSCAIPKNVPWVLS